MSRLLRQQEKERKQRVETIDISSVTHHISLLDEIFFLKSNMTIKLCETIGRNSSSSSHQWKLSYAEWIPNTLSSMTFLLALIGNTAALIVMFGWRGPIRLTNNKYLANLACADLLRACFMPFTIIARMKKNFLFGKMICQILPIVQGKQSSFFLNSSSSFKTFE